MTRERKNLVTDLRGAGRLAIDATTGLTDLVEAMHAAISPVVPASRKEQARTAGVTGLVSGYGMLLTYEWTHHLIHSSYRPKGRYYRSIWRSHRLHHYRNEQYWFGVTVNLADHVLRTFPARDEVPASPTARTLGVGADLRSAGS